MELVLVQSRTFWDVEVLIRKNSTSGGALDQMAVILTVGGRSQCKNCWSWNAMSFVHADT